MINNKSIDSKLKSPWEIEDIQINKESEKFFLLIFFIYDDSKQRKLKNQIPAS